MNQEVAPLSPSPGIRKKKQYAPRKTGQPSRLSKKVRAALDRTALACGGLHTERMQVEPPKGSPNYVAGDEVKLTEESRRALRLRACVMIIVECDCPLCRDGRWVAVNMPWKHDPTQKQHYASCKLRRADKKQEIADEDAQE